jgi:hypothetical protein
VGPWRADSFLNRLRGHNWRPQGKAPQTNRSRVNPGSLVLCWITHRASEETIVHLKSRGEPFVFADTDWGLFETRYGHKLTKEVRQLISLTTLIFSFRAPGAPDEMVHVRPMLTKIRKLQLSIDSILHDLSTSGTPPETSLEFLYDFVFRSKQQIDIFFPILKFDILGHKLYDLKHLCKLIDTELNDPDCLSSEMTQQWNVWIVMLTLVLRWARLPTKVRKDVDKQKTESPFVQLVRELQIRMPRSLRRQLSDDSLAQAIYRARKTVPLDLDGKSPKVFLLTMLGVLKLIHTSENECHLEVNENWAHFLHENNDTKVDWINLLHSLGT